MIERKWQSSFARVGPGSTPPSTSRLTPPTGGLADTVAMTFTDYLLNGTLIALVLLQIRGRRVTVRSLALPIGVVVFAAVQYLHGIPTGANNLALVLTGALTGLVLGAGLTLGDTNVAVSAPA